MSPRVLLNGLFSGAIVLALLFFAQMIFTPDAGASFFAKGQQLESAGQIPLALQHYRLVSENHPESVFAPRALLRQGDLLAAQGRQSGKTAPLRQAVTAYAKLAKNYPSDPLANEALFDAGQISSESLHDIPGARGYYKQLLSANSPNSDAAAMVTLKLGRLALDEHNGSQAQTLFKRVLQRWPRNAQIGAEAQFYLGVVYETLLKKSEWATNAYDATIARYPTSTWANNARERLGLLVFSTMGQVRPARRVLIDVDPLPDDNGLGEGDTSSPWNALRPLLASRGLGVSDLTLRGWSLTPFWAGIDTTNPSRVVGPSFDTFENVVANAGLRFTLKKGGRESESLSDLQDDIDSGRLPVVYFSEKGKGRWMLCVGYDTERSEVFLQDHGARFDTLTAKAFAAGWKAKSSFGEPFTMMSFVATSRTQNAKPNLTPTPMPTPAPGKTTVPVLEAPPAFIVRLPKLDRVEGHTRTLNRAAILMQRNGNGQILLGATALGWLANELEATTKASSMEHSEEATLARELNDEETPSMTPIPEGEESALETPTPTPEAPAAPSDNASANAAKRARRLLSFFRDPARQWVALRRQASSYCDLAARQLDSKNLPEAAEAFNQSADSVEEASRLVPQIGDTISSRDREAIAAIVSQLRRAREAERQAARRMIQS